MMPIYLKKITIDEIVLELFNKTSRMIWIKKLRKERFTKYF